MQLKKKAKYALLVPTSMGVRITPASGQPVHCSSLFTMQATSAETNVASVASYLGLPVKVLTAFVKGSPVARFIKDNLASRHMDYEGPEVEQGGPWGFRHQFNIADSGYGSRGPRVSFNLLTPSIVPNNAFVYVEQEAENITEAPKSFKLIKEGKAGQVIYRLYQLDWT